MIYSTKAFIWKKELVHTYWSWQFIFQQKFFSFFSDTQPWNKLKDWTHLIELDLVSMRFANIQSLLKVVGPKLESLTLEIDEEQGKGSELVFMARNCPNLKKIRILIGDKTLMGESNLCYDLPFFRKVER